MENAREARRRRIVQRGTDRLAFITGEVQSIPKQEDPPSTVASLPEDDAVSLIHQASDQIASSTVENDDRKELFLKHETSRELPKCETSDKIPTRKKSIELLNYETNNGRSVELSTTSVAHISSDRVGNTAPFTAPKTSHRNFTFSQISSSISASEDIRLLCSIIIALLVVLSYHGYSLGGKVVGSIINFRPLFLVLLTDATVVFGRLLVIHESEHKGKEEARRTSQEEHGLVNDIGKALVVVMVFWKALGAAFMDCSICAVIMISGIVV